MAASLHAKVRRCADPPGRERLRRGGQIEARWENATGGGHVPCPDFFSTTKRRARREGAAPLNGSGSREPRIEEELAGEGGLIPDGGGRRGEGGGGDRGGLDFSAREEIGRTNLTPCSCCGSLC